MLKIAEQVFDLDSSEFQAHVRIGQNGWQVSWGLELRGRPKEVDGIEWRPHLSAHAFSTQLPGLDKLAGTTLQLEDCDEDDEPLFMLCVFEHEPVRDVRLSFQGWQGSRIQFRLEGVVDVYADDAHGADLPVEVELLLPFDGVVVDEGHADKAGEKFARFFDPGSFGPADSRGVGRGFVFRLKEA